MAFSNLKMVCIFKGTVSEEIKFLVDHMLGKLAKYLRFMGYDVFYPPRNMSDNEIIRIAEKENRTIITRDRELAKRANGFYVKSGDYHEQLKMVAKKYRLKMNEEIFLSRCSVCNEPLVKVPKEEIRGKVPEYVYEHNDEFYICPKCHRIYWYGTHTERIERDIRKILEEGEKDED